MRLLLLLWISLINNGHASMEDDSDGFTGRPVRQKRSIIICPIFGVWCGPETTTEPVRQKRSIIICPIFGVWCGPETTTTPTTTTTEPETTTTLETTTTAEPTTTTTTTTTTSDTTTSATTTTSITPVTTSTLATTTIVDTGLCGPYTDENGVTFDNRCKTKDGGAQCDMDTSMTYCTCSAGWTGTYCSVDAQSLGNIGGDSAEKLIDVIETGKANPATVIAALPALLSFLTDQQRAYMSYSVEDMIVEASFEEKSLNVREAFTMSNDPSLGNCLTFNHFNATDKYLARGLGPRFGLRVTLAFNVEEYAPWVESVGILTYMHPIGQSIYLESVKYTVQPGNSDEIAMKKSSFKRMRGLFTTKCISNVHEVQSFYFPGEYSVDGCLRSCYQDSVLRSCGCMDPSYARKRGVKSCAFDKLSCIDKMSVERGDPYYWPECTCSVPCAEEEYRYDTSRAMLIQRQSSNCINCTETSLTSEVTIYLATLDVRAQVEEWTFPLSRVLGLTGGFGGVLLGASVVFLMEIIVLIVRVGLIGFINKDTMIMSKRDNE